MELAAWNFLDRRYDLRETYGSPNALVGTGVVGTINRWSRNKGLAGPIEFIFEHGDRGKGHLTAQLAKQNIMPIFQSQLKALPCQAADLLAWKHRIAMNDASRLATGDNEGWAEIQRSLAMLSVRPAQSGIYDMKSLRKLCTAVCHPRR